VAGVGFSLNPLSNDYDEAVIDANWGLGESVVAGLVSPDHFIVNKVNRQVVDKQLGRVLKSGGIAWNQRCIEVNGEHEVTENEAILRP